MTPAVVATLIVLAVAVISACVSAMLDAPRHYEGCRFCGKPVTKGLQICAACRVKGYRA